MLARALRRAPLAGRSIAAVEPRGKHLLIVFREAGAEDAPPLEAPALPGVSLRPSDRVLHTHLGMDGSWHLYRTGQEWHRPARFAALAIHTASSAAACCD